MLQVPQMCLFTQKLCTRSSNMWPQRQRRAQPQKVPRKELGLQVLINSMQDKSRNFKHDVTSSKYPTYEVELQKELPKKQISYGHFL